MPKKHQTAKRVDGNLALERIPEPVAHLEASIGQAMDAADRKGIRAARTPLAIIVGNEGSGLSAATLAACTHLARIPMAPGADSINVATSLAVALYQLT